MIDPKDYIGKTFVALHRYMFRVGQPATIVGVVLYNGRECFRLRYEDGIHDLTMVYGRAGTRSKDEGIFYRIEGTANHE